jgi:hypothetical protein
MDGIWKWNEIKQGSRTNLALDIWMLIFFIYIYIYKGNLDEWVLRLWTMTANFVVFYAVKPCSLLDSDTAVSHFRMCCSYYPFFISLIFAPSFVTSVYSSAFVFVGTLILWCSPDSSLAGVCVCVCVRVRACVRACVCVCVSWQVCFTH